jgi:hypothetical protein
MMSVFIGGIPQSVFVALEFPVEKEQQGYFSLLLSPLLLIQASLPG